MGELQQRYQEQLAVRHKQEPRIEEDFQATSLQAEIKGNPHKIFGGFSSFFIVMLPNLTLNLGLMVKMAAHLITMTLGGTVQNPLWTRSF